MNYKEHPLWIELEQKRLEKIERNKPKPSVFDGLITEITTHTTTKVL